MDLALPSSSSAPWLASALWLVARGTVLLTVAALAVLALRRAPAAWRHLAWCLALAGMLALPALSLAAPRWELGFVRVAAPEAGTASGAAAAGIDGGTLLLALWAAGVALVLGRYALAVAGVRRAARRARRISDPAWLRRLAAAARELGLREEVRLLSVEGSAMPMTWGILRPVVLLPAEAARWSEERHRVVLLHELAHVARRDCLWQALASLACAAYWFHPGVWWAARRMRVEREQACDDRVLAVGTRASDYARHLLEVARACRPRPFTAAAAVGLARRSQLEERVVAVLDAARAHGAVPARAAAVAAAVAGLVLLPLAAARPGGVAPVRTGEPVVTILAAERAAPRPAEPPPALLPADPGPPPPAPSRVAAASSPLVSPRPRAVAPAPAPSLPLDSERAVAALLRAIHDPDPRVRSAAATALGELATSPPAPSTGSARPDAPPTAARTAPAPSAPLDPALRILGGLGEDTTYVDFPAGRAPGAP